MEEIKRESIVQKYTSADKLPSAGESLLQHAKEAISTSYAPYSKFHVGCAVLLENGEIVKGSNQENIAYPSGLCAERVAVFHAGATYPDVAINTIAVTAKAQNYTLNEPVMCCGACLQAMSEYEMKFKKPIRVILQGETGDVYVAESIRTFMPFMFWVDELKG